MQVLGLRSIKAFELKHDESFLFNGVIYTANREVADFVYPAGTMNNGLILAYERVSHMMTIIPAHMEVLAGNMVTTLGDILNEKEPAVFIFEGHISQIRPETDITSDLITVQNIVTGAYRTVTKDKLVLI